MGWTEYFATEWKKGRIDRKAECDKELNRHATVLKSRMVGSTYYAAVKENESVYGMVMHTKTGNAKFSYKDQPETMCPCAVDCPRSILELLTPTDNEYAKLWRKKCWEKINNHKEQDLSKLKIGTVISFVNPYENLNSGIKKGETVRLTKSRRGRRSCWINGMYRWQPTMIPDNYVVERYGGNANVV